jgi:hypothetical protein
MTMTKQDLIELRGCIISIIRSKITRTIPDAPCWLEESATWIVAKGQIKSLGAFMTVFDQAMANKIFLINKFDQKKEMGLYQMRRLEHLCGVPAYEYESLPSYHQAHPAPEGVDSSAANRRHSEAFSRWSDESDRLQIEFGGEVMLKTFEERFAEYQMARLTAGVLRELGDGEKRMTFQTGLELLNFMHEPAYDQLLDFHDAVIMRAPDQTFVIDVIKKSEQEAA